MTMSGRATSMLSRRRFLQAAAVVGGGSAVGSTLWSHLCAASPMHGAHIERFAGATETLDAQRTIAIWTSSGTVERGRRLTIRAASQYPELDVWIHRVGASDDAVWGCTRAWVADGSIGEVVADWQSGLYLISAMASRNGNSGSEADADAVAFHPFVVTDQHSTAAITVQVPFATYQAYNAWTPRPSVKRSLYDFNSPGGRSHTVAIDRPYDGFDGAGFLFYGDHQLAEWLTTEGIDVNYTTSWDTHHRPELLDRTRLFISNFHDEYWSRRMRADFERRVRRGMNATFFGANSLYWQIDLEGNTMSCDKVAGGPQGTFRSVGDPEADLLGANFESYRHPYGVMAADWVVSNADHWVYDGTGLDDGDTIDRLVGYEWDRMPGDRPGPGVTALASSPIDDAGRHHHATIVERTGQGTVFNAGTNYWPRLLTGGGHWPADAAVQQMTRNLIAALGT